MMVKTYFDKICERRVQQFKSNYPQDHWSLSFMSRHKDSLSHRLCQNVAPEWATVNPEDITHYLKNLETTATTYSLKGHIEF